MKVAVIGSGLAGLVAGVTLAARGEQVHVLERRGVCGGRAASVVDAISGDAVGASTHVVGPGAAATRALAAEFGQELGEWPVAGNGDPAAGEWVTGGTVVLSPVAGWSSLIDALVARLRAHGGELSTRALVQGVEVEAGRVRGVTWLQRAVGRSEIRRGVPARTLRQAVDAVVCALPPWALAELMPGDPATDSVVSGFTPVATTVIETWWDRPPLASAIIPPGRAASQGAWLFQPGLLAGVAPSRRLAVVPLQQATPPSGWSDFVQGVVRAEPTATAGASLERLLVLRDPGGGLPAPLDVRAPQATLPGLVLAGDWTQGEASIDAAVRSGLRAADQVSELAR